MSALPNISSVQTLAGCGPHRRPSRVFESEVPIVLEGPVAKWPAAGPDSQSLASATSHISGGFHVADLDEQRLQGHVGKYLER